MSALLAVTGPRAGLRYPLGAAALIFGRASSCDVQVIDLSVARQHFETHFEDGAHWLRCLGSSNGTFLNGRRISPESNERLRPGDVIQAGTTVFVYQAELEYLRGEGTDVIVAPEPITAIQRRPVTGEPDATTARVLLELLAKAAAGQAGEAEDPLQRALAVISARFSADRAFVLKVDADGQLGRVARSFGQGPIVVSRTVIRTVIEEQQAVAFGDAAGAFLLQGGVSLAAGEIRSLLAAPLLYDQRTFGVLHVDRKDRHAYTVADLEAFAAASRLVALMLLATSGLEQKRRTKRRAPAPRPLGDSPVFQRLLKEAERAARTDSSVLLVGPTGSGKEVLARFLHEQSPRAEGPFVAINCGAIPEALAESELFGHEAGAFTGATTAKVGLFEAASGGTLFLDEVGATHKNTQTKLLRALQERVFQRLGSTTLRSVELRVIAASDRPLAHLVAEGLFRADLAFRLAVVTLEVPPLSARPGDVPLLAQSFVQTIAQEIGMGEKQLDPEVLARLEARAWPGNVRELRNTIERLVILSEGPRIGLGDLPTDLLAGLDQVDRAARSGQTLAEVLAEVEKAMILRAMARTGGVKVAAAEALGISRVTLDAKLKAYGRGPEKKFRDPSTAE